MLRQRLDDVALASILGDVDGRQLTAASTSLRAQLDRTTAALADRARTPVLGGLLRAGDVRAAWEALALDLRRSVIDALMEVQLHPPGRGARAFDPVTVEVAWRGIG